MPLIPPDRSQRTQARAAIVRTLRERGIQWLATSIESAPPNDLLAGVVQGYVIATGGDDYRPGEHADRVLADLAAATPIDREQALTAWATATYEDVAAMAKQAARERTSVDRTAA